MVLSNAASLMKVVSISIHNHTRGDAAQPVTLTLAQDLSSFGFFQRGSVRESVPAESCCESLFTALLTPWLARAARDMISTLQCAHLNAAASLVVDGHSFVVMLAIFRVLFVCFFARFCISRRSRAATSGVRAYIVRSLTATLFALVSAG